MMKKLYFAIASFFILIGCSSHPPIRTENNVDIDRFMGDWYVIANIPTFIEKGAHNAIESYSRNEDGSIATTFTFYQDSFDGEKKAYHPTGFIYDKESNAVWGMQFIWPIESDYRIVYLNDDYTQTIIGRVKRDYVWIMARSPEIPDSEFNQLVEIIKQEGYDVDKLQKVPQQWQAGK
ncbi:MAG: lipocalin family protein [Thioalkalispiraceae bacterium]|jgi:apolipoprotein D and lipocalin family protein